jgi:glycosyltransferase 2 family protein
VDADSPPAGAPRRSRWRTVAVLAVVAAFFVATLAARWNDVISLKWRLEPGLFAAATALLALSYGLVACLWGLALHRAAGTRVVAGARIWFLSNLARYVPGNVWSYVGAVELARREGVARRTTLAVMALTQVLSVGVALLAGLPVLLAERARLGRPALLGAVVVAAGAGLAAVFRRRLLGLARRRMPGFDPAGLTPSAGTVALLVAGYALYWAVTGLAFAALVASLYPLAPADVPLVMAAYAAAYAAGFLALLTPAGLGVREGVLVVALAPVLPAGPALVVALLSRVWMMLVELAGAGVAHLADRCRTPV